MKVTTEASLFGAWVGSQLNGVKGKVLDIGTGTGLLSLMIAQETIMHIDAIEIDAKAALQAKENLQSSPWKDRIKVIHEDILNFTPTEKYDFLISNPPFYENDLTSPDEGKRKAHHGESLKLSKMVKKMEELLNDNGTFFLLFPAHRKDELIRELNFCRLYAVIIEHVFNDDREKPFRIFLKGTRKDSVPEERKLYIRREGSFTDAFRKLMLPYYLPQALQQNQKDIRSGE